MTVVTLVTLVTLVTDTPDMNGMTNTPVRPSTVGGSRRDLQRESCSGV